MSPCQKYLLYSTINANANIINIAGDVENKYNLTHDSQSFGIGNNTRDFAIYSIKFSGHGNELLAGTNDNSIEVYDLSKRRAVLRVQGAHQDDVNTVCWANRDASQVFFTGSDDSSIKIWDKRSLRTGRKCEGAFIGHREGISHISSRGDGLHLISNGKDQCLKLWDIRKHTSEAEFAQFAAERNYQSNFDYRWDSYPLTGYRGRLSADCSLLTFRGHSVLSTLIRCYFSPLFSTAQRYLYTGCASGMVHIFDSITGKTVGRLCPEMNVRQQMPAARDVAWHPVLPLVTATSFYGDINCYYYDA